MEDKELLTLAGRLNLPEAVLAPLAAAAPVLSVHIPSDAVLDSGAFWRRPTPAPGSGPLTGDFGHGGRLAGCCSGWGRWNLNIGGCGQGLSQRE